MTFQTLRCALHCATNNLCCENGLKRRGLTTLDRRNRSDIIQALKNSLGKKQYTVGEVLGMSPKQPNSGQSQCKTKGTFDKCSLVQELQAYRIVWIVVLSQPIPSQLSM